MTSEMATANSTSSTASKADIVIAAALKDTNTNCNDKDSKTVVTFGPITDKKIAISEIPPYSPNATDCTTNKASNCSSFQRSTSLRLRGTKSNLLLHATRNSSNKSLEQPERLKTERLVLPTSSTPTQETFTAGRTSLRRAFANYADLNRVTRSFSLRRNYKISESDKTDTSKETCSLSTTDSCDTLKDAAINALEGDTKTEVNKATESKNAKMTDADEVKTVDESMHLNCAVTTSLTTTSTSTATTTTQTLVRPATLATTKTAVLANGSIPNCYSKTTSSQVKTPKTPKTPTTTLLQQPFYSQHNANCAHHAKPCSLGKQPLSNVPEASSPCSKLTPKTPPVTPDSPSTYLEDDLDSMYSFATTTSGRSTMSCEHPYVARNGTTFSGRKMKYVVHCSNYAGQVGPDYLTPTQRAQRQLRRLKEILCVARQDLEQKDSEILRLTREVVELRLFKASLSSPEERSASSDAITVREAELKTSQDVSPIVDMVDDAAKGSPRHMAANAAAQHNQQLNQQNVMQLSTEMQSSYADSGHFEDMTSSSVHSKDSQTQDMACGSDEASADANADEIAAAAANACENFELQRQKIIMMYEQRIEELIRNQDAITSDIKRSHNDRVEALLQKLAECNTRYADIVPDYEHAKERIRELEKQLEDLQHKLAEHEEKQNKMYLHMYQKGQEAERIAHADQALELAHRAPNKVSINELLQQLQSTQDELENIRTIYRRLLEAQKNRTHVDPEVTLQFLKSAIYYFLTDKENSQGHLQAIESILDFTETEKQNISKARMPK